MCTQPAGPYMATCVVRLIFVLGCVKSSELCCSGKLYCGCQLILRTYVNVSRSHMQLSHAPVVLAVTLAANMHRPMIGSWNLVCVGQFPWISLEKECWIHYGLQHEGMQQWYDCESALSCLLQVPGVAPSQGPADPSRSTSQLSSMPEPSSDVVNVTGSDQTAALPPTGAVGAMQPTAASPKGVQVNLESIEGHNVMDSGVNISRGASFAGSEVAAQLEDVAHQVTRHMA